MFRIRQFFANGSEFHYKLFQETTLVIIPSKLAKKQYSGAEVNVKSRIRYKYPQIGENKRVSYIKSPLKGLFTYLLMTTPACHFMRVKIVLRMTSLDKKKKHGKKIFIIAYTGFIYF